MSKHKKMSVLNTNQDDETETRLVLLESLIQSKNKEIESYQKQIMEYNRLQEDYMNSQHKLIGLQTEFDKVSAENKKLRKEIKSTNANTIVSGKKKPYGKFKQSKLHTKCSQTSNEDFQSAAYKWYQGIKDGDKSYSTKNVTTLNDNELEYHCIENDEKDLAAELVREVTAAASEVAREQYLASMVYEETSGLYYDYKTGYYFDAERSLFYDGNSGTYYTYNYETSAYEIYSEVPVYNSIVAKIKGLKTCSTNKGYRTGKKKVDQIQDKHDLSPIDVSIKVRRKRTLSVDVDIGNGKDTNDMRHKERTCYSAPPSPYSCVEFSEEPKRQPETSCELEEGEISSGDTSLSSEYDKYDLGTISETEEETRLEENSPAEQDCSSSKYISPCVRLMVINNDSFRSKIVQSASNTAEAEEGEKTKSSEMKEGTLFLITCMGGSIGREGAHHVVLLDREIGCSKDHATIMFLDEKFYLVDKGSTNGTFLNDKCLTKNKPSEIGHGSLISIGNTAMKCHVHPGKETCFECEPGVIANSFEQNGSDRKNRFVSKSKKERLRKKEQKRLQNKYNLYNSGDQRVATDDSAYKDRAEERRKEKGSDNPHEATHSASLDKALDDTNKGFNMLSKMGWKKGEGLGIESNQGIVEPIKIETRVERAGLGADDVFKDVGMFQMPTKKHFDFKMRKKAEVMKQIQKRFENLQSNLEEDSTDGTGDAKFDF